MGRRILRRGMVLRGEKGSRGRGAGSWWRRILEREGSWGGRRVLSGGPILGERELGSVLMEGERIVKGKKGPGQGKGPEWGLRVLC